MKKKNTNVAFISLTFILSVFLLLPTFLVAQVYDNIGFKKDIPEEIRKACPQCDEFLDVKWIDEKRMIGKLEAEIYRKDKKVGSQYFLVKLEDPGSEYFHIRGNGMLYDMTREEYPSKKFEKFIKEAEYTFEAPGFIGLIAKRGKEQRHFSGPYIFEGESYGDFSKTICILYPNKEYVLILETKKPFLKKDISNELKAKYEQILRYAKGKCQNIYECKLDRIKYTDALDVNLDGLEDYIFRFWVGRERNVVVFFSKKNSYEFKEISHRCAEVWDIFYLKKDSRITVYFGKCNLTELTKGGY